MPGFAERFEVRTPTYAMSREERRRIHGAALEVLARTGVRFPSEKARRALKAAGADVRSGSDAVRFAPDLVASLLRTAPSKVVLAGRTKEYDLPLDGTREHGGHTFFTTDGCGVSVWDPDRGTRRPSLLEDLRRSVVIADYLPYVAAYVPMVVATDLPERVHLVHGMRTIMENTAKHILTEETTWPEEAEAQIRMASEVLGGREELRKRHYLSAVVCLTSPLLVEERAAEDALVWASCHVPVHLMSMATAGLSGPATLAGDVTIGHAEALAAACMVQAAEPGAPVIYGNVLAGMDPRTGAYQGSSPESILLSAGSVDMARYVGLPHSTGGFGTNAKMPGAQASIEHTISAMASVGAGVEVVNGIGELLGSTMLSYEQLLIDHEICANVLRLHRGYAVDDETIARDLINRVGPGGSYLAQRHTVRHMKDVYLPWLWDNEPFDSWVAKGSKGALALAQEKAEWIVAHHTPEPLEPSTSRALDAIVRGFGKPEAVLA